MPKDTVPLDKGQRRVHRIFKDKNVILNAKELVAIAKADNELKQGIDTIYLAGSKVLLDGEELISEPKWFVDKDAAILKADKFKQKGGGVVYSLNLKELRDSDEKDDKTLFGCFTTLNDDEIIADLINKEKNQLIDQKIAKSSIIESSDGIKLDDTGKPIGGSIYQTDVYFDVSCKVDKDILKKPIYTTGETEKSSRRKRTKKPE